MRRVRETPYEPHEAAEISTRFRKPLISPERITMMMDPTQYLLFRFSLAYSLRPLLIAYSKTLEKKIASEYL